MEKRLSALRRRVVHRATAVAAAYLLDDLFGEPPDTLHPLRAFGAVMSVLERTLYEPRRLNGALYTVAGVVTAAAIGAAVPSVTLAGYITTGGRALADAAYMVATALDRGDLESARQGVRALVGRDSQTLDEAELARAVVESVAESTNDGVVAPLFWALVGGAVGAYCYRAANTLDSLVGYRNDRYRKFGWASARLDDIASFVPARVTALLVAAVRPRRWRQVLTAVRNDARKHPSPNAGVVESAFAGALGLELGGTNSYGGMIEHRPCLGAGPRPGRADVERAVNLSRDVAMAAVLAMLGGSLLVRSTG